MTDPYNPLDMHNIADSIAVALMKAPAKPMELLHTERFSGAGIYAIYYSGPFPAYEVLAERNREEPTIPVYVGKAIPEGGRRGAAPTDPLAAEVVTQIQAPRDTPALRRRLLEHRSSVVSAENLDVSDFSCRWLVIEPIWIPLGETAMISRFMPLWNRIIDGFGNHAPGAGRNQGMVPRWDLLHPGRDWATRLQDRLETPDDVAAEAKEYLRSRLA